MATTTALGNAQLEVLRGKTLYACACTAVGSYVTPTFTEVTNAGAYARQPIGFNAAAGKQIVQAAQVTFPKATADYPAPVMAIALVDSATYGAGTCWHIIPLDSPLTIANNGQLVFDAGALVANIN